MNANNRYDDIKELSGSLEVLYVEDEKDTRDAIYGLLELFFKNIVVAVDGDDAIEKLKNFKPDLLITDIQMPNKNGLDLIRYIKQNYADLAVIITTAFSNKDYIFESFDLGVSQYLIKPIKQDSLINAIFQVSKQIDNSKKAKELEEYKVQQMVGYASEHILEQILGSLTSPCMIYTNNKLRYKNHAFDTMINSKDVDKLFEKKDGYITKLEDYDEKNPANNKVSISKNNGRKIYKLIKNSINIDEVVQKSDIYFFIDITLEEYQKIKIKSYTEILESIVFKIKYKDKESKPEPIESKKKLNINDEENELLRRSHTHKTTAEEYVEELDDETLSELQELDELDKDFSESIAVLREDSNIDGLKQMASQLQKYSHEISLLFEFKDLAYAIESLSTLFYTVDESKLDERKLNKIFIILEGIKDDLAAWRNVIFIEKNANDIHYLDSSLFSACLQIELLISDEVSEMESEEDDFELF